MQEFDVPRECYEPLLLKHKNQVICLGWAKDQVKLIFVDVHGFRQDLRDPIDHAESGGRMCFAVPSDQKV